MVSLGTLSTTIVDVPHIFVPHVYRRLSDLGKYTIAINKQIVLKNMGVY